VTAGDIAATTLLALAVLAELVCVAGVVWMRDVHDQLHFSAAATAVAPALVAGAACITGFSSLSGVVECVAACAALFVLNPILASATGRAARSADFGDIEPGTGKWQER
jgi:multisubunit Na+/H+ antiporter MnhG subunit